MVVSLENFVARVLYFVNINLLGKYFVIFENISIYFEIESYLEAHYYSNFFFHKIDELRSI